MPQKRYTYKSVMPIFIAVFFFPFFLNIADAATKHKKPVKKTKHVKPAKPAKHAKRKPKGAKTEKTKATNGSHKEEEEENPLTGNFTLATNYMFRGISQTNNIPVVQGGLTYTFKKIGLFFNIWGSNVNFTDPRDRPATVELDTVVGITNDIGKHFNYNAYFIHYNYPRTDSNYNEGMLYLTLYFLQAQLGYSGNVYNSHATGIYYNLGLKFEIPAKYFFHLENVTFSGGFGHYSLPRSRGLPSYNDYNAQLSKSIGNYNLAVQWTDTNGRSNDAPQLRNSHIIGILTANF